MKIQGKGVERMTRNYNRLIGKIAEVCRTRAKYAEQLGIAEGTLTNKLAGRTDFTQSEIDKSCEILNINKIDIPVYFFS